MKFLFLLSGEAIELAKAEVLSLFKIERHISIGRYLFLNTNRMPQSLIYRLAYTKKVYKMLFICKDSEIESRMNSFNWKSIYKNNFCLRLHAYNNVLSFGADKLAGYVWRAVLQPKVCLESPNTMIEIFFINGMAYCGLALYNQTEEFEQRKAHKRPALHPVSLHPKLARCLVNLSGARKGEIIVEPFCGIGGIMIEAWMIGCRTIGYDIDKVILAKCRKNLDYFGIKGYNLINSDATKIKRKHNYIVTDLPYGKSTVIPKNLYLNFLITLKKILCRRAVVVFPDFVDYKRLIRKANLKILGEYSYYIHKSMTKRIVVLC